MRDFINTLGADQTLGSLAVIGGNLALMILLFSGARKLLRTSAPRVRRSLRNRRLSRFKEVIALYKSGEIRKKAGFPAFLIAKSDFTSFVASIVISFGSILVAILNLVMWTGAASISTNAVASAIAMMVWLLAGNIFGVKSATHFFRMIRIVEYAQNPEIFRYHLMSEARRARRNMFY